MLVYMYMYMLLHVECTCTIWVCLSYSALSNGWLCYSKKVSFETWYFSEKKRRQLRLC